MKEQVKRVYIWAFEARITEVRKAGPRHLKLRVKRFAHANHCYSLYNIYFSRGHLSIYPDLYFGKWKRNLK